MGVMAVDMELEDEVAEVEVELEEIEAGDGGETAGTLGVIKY